MKLTSQNLVPVAIQNNLKHPEHILYKQLNSKLQKSKQPMLSSQKL